MSSARVRTCDNCGALRNVNDTFCGNCGKPFNASVLAEVPPTAISPAVGQSHVTQVSDSRQVYTPVLHHPQSNLRYIIAIAVLVALLIGMGSFELGQLVKGNQPGSSSNNSSSSNNAGAIPADTAQLSATPSPAQECPTSGGYFKIVNVKSGQVLEVPNGSLQSGVLIRQHPYNGGLGQQWQFVLVGEGYFKIVNMSSDQVIDVPNATQASNVSIQQYTYNTGLGQQWQCVPVSGGYFKIVSVSSSLVLDIPNTPGNASLLQDQDSGASTQHWQFAVVNTPGCPATSGYDKIVNANSSLVLDVPNHSGYDPLLQDQDSGASTQHWQFVPAGGYFKIVNMKSGLVLEVPNNSLTSGVLVHQYPFNGGLDQLWQCVPVGEGYFTIVNINSDQVLDVPGATRASNVSIQQYTYNAGLGQQWQFVPS